LPQNPTTRGTNTKAEFGIGEDLQQFSVNYLPLLLQGLELPSDLHTPLEHLTGAQVRQMREWVWALLWKGLEEVLQGTRR